MVAIKKTVTVQSGGKIEISAPELRPGSTAEIIVLADETATAEQKRDRTQFLELAARIREKYDLGPIHFTRDELHERR
jgi:hypothetical protein